MIELMRGVILGQVDLESPEVIGAVMGAAFALCFLAFGIAKCRVIARRPTANWKCLLSLGLVLAIFALSAVSRLVTLFAPKLVVVTVICGLIGLAAMPVAMVFAIIGLAECRSDKARYVQGRGQAFWALGLVILSGCSMAGLAIHGFNQVRGLAGTPLANQPRSGDWLRFEDLNFKLRTPGRPWVQLDGKKFNKNVTVAFSMNKPSVTFMLVAEKLGANALSTDGLVEVVKTHVKGGSDSNSILKEAPVSRLGLQGVGLEFDARSSGYHLFYSDWVCSTNGYAYQLLTWGAVEDAQTVRARSEEVFSGFQLLDYARVALLETAHAKNFTSDLFGYSVDLSGTGYRPSPLMSKNLPSAELTVWDETREVGLFVIPIALLNWRPDGEAVTQAMLDYFGITVGGPEVQQAKSIVEPPLSGVQFPFERGSATSQTTYRAKVLSNSKRAYLVGAYQAKGTEEAGRALEKELARVKFVPENAFVTPPQDKLNNSDKQRHGLFFNNLGLFYYRAQQFQKSADYFREGFDFNPQSPVFLENLTRAFWESGKQRDALDGLESHPELVEQKPSLRALEASLQAQLDKLDAALTNFATLFAGGYREDDYFKEYVNLLLETKPDAALEVVEKYLLESDSAVIRALQAKVYLAKKETAKAIDLLKAQAQKYPFNSDLKISLANAYSEAGLYPEAVGVCQQMIDSAVDSASVHYLKGTAEFGLKRYREAKASFEAALKKAPASNETKRYLELVSGMLGEGNNSGVKEVIEPVSIPERFLTNLVAEPPAAYVKDFGARYLKDISAIEFVRKKVFKRTDFLSVQVLDAGGVAAFSTIQFAFNPLSEALFVNELVVRDESGKVVGTGKVDDYYVVDASSQAGSHATLNKILNVPVSGLRPGCRIDLKATRRDLAPPEEFPFTEHLYLATFPVLEDVFLIRGETNQLKITGAGAGSGQVIDEAICWLRERPELYKWEPMQPAAQDFLPGILVGDSSDTWEAEGRKYLDKLGEYFQLDTAGKELASRLAGASGNEAARVFELAHYVQTNFTYKAIEFGRRAQIPHRTTEIQRNQYGDCKDHALLLQQLLQASGVGARLALVRSLGPIRKEIPSLDQFDHMIVYLPAFQNGFFLDCTDKGSDLSQVTPYGLAGREAFILDPAGPRFVTIPNYPAGYNQISSRREVRFTNETDLVVHEILTLKGAEGSTMRSYFKEMQTAARRRFLESQITRQSGELTRVDFRNLEDTSQPMELELDYVLKRQFRSLDKQLVGKLPDVWEEGLLAVTAVDRRSTPFELTVPLEMESSITVMIPAGYQAPKPEDFALELKTELMHSQSSARKEGNGLRVDFRFQRPAGKYVATQYGSLRENTIKALAPLEQTIAFAKKK